MKIDALRYGTALVSLTMATLLWPPLAPAQQIATESRTSGAITFAPRAATSGWTLRLAGPDGLVQRFSPGLPPSILVVDAQGSTLPDGRYRYELIPVYPEQANAVEPRSTPLSGDFVVVQGAIALAAIDSSPSSPPGESSGTPPATDGVSDNASGNSTEPPMSSDTALSDDYCIGNGCSDIGSFPTAGSGTGYLKLKGAATGLIFSDTNSSSFTARDWQIAVNDGSANQAEYFAVFDNGPFGDSGAFNAADAQRVPFRIDGGAPTNALRIEGNGDIGMGTATPDRSLEILGASPAIRLSDDAGVEWTINQNSSSTIFDIVSTRLGADSVRHVRINRSAPPNQLVLNPSGVGVGRTQTEAPLDIEGNAIVRGDLSVLSSRDAKTDFSDAEIDALLDSLAELPMRTWRYKHEETGTRHLGPVAQEFHAAFALGSHPERVSPMDGVGVALASIQALDRREQRTAQAMAAALAEKDAHIERLEKRLLALEAFMAGELATRGDRVSDTN